MFYIILSLILILMILGPQWWVRYVLSHYGRELPEARGTGGELAEHLLSSFKLENVAVESAPQDQDHYSPEDNVVRLSPTILQGKSLTAIAVAAHEVGHAIQFNRQEKVCQLRQRYLGKALRIQRIGAGFLMVSPIILAVLRVPHIMLITIIVGVITMLSSVAMYAAILPEEWDASFNKALPILIEGNYITAEQVKPVRRILAACALTYVAAALADVLSLWRWLAILRR